MKIDQTELGAQTDWGDQTAWGARDASAFEN